ncbi:response regulator transcription factor [Patulibacter brassicae]|uniref:Response regulator transcription factor n=1 Tax=Patulibacter brassicae TaxID=1705717 RepID=A0ABU4VPM1_9ACTN|nr:response regulator transcription factor [Patulibacter brassicae]MDX8153805.1 response regulator transcription factor [Patulibacter brassicae]
MASPDPRSDAPPLKLVLADDEAVLRAGLRAILEAEDDLRVVGEASDGAEAVEVTLATHADVVFMDVRMPRLDGIAATRRLVAAGSRARVLVLTTFDADEAVVEALRAGAAGFLLKDGAPDRLAEAARTVARGEALLAPGITRRLIEQHVERSGRPELRPALDALTPRELDVLRELAAGRSNAEIAAALFLAEATVKTHLTSILAKLGLRSRVQAVVYAYESGLVVPGAGGD